MFKYLLDNEIIVIERVDRHEIDVLLQLYFASDLTNILNCSNLFNNEIKDNQIKNTKVEFNIVSKKQIELVFNYQNSNTIFINKLQFDSLNLNRKKCLKKCLQKFSLLLLNLVNKDQQIDISIYNSINYIEVKDNLLKFKENKFFDLFLRIFNEYEDFLLYKFKNIKDDFESKLVINDFFKIINFNLNTVNQMLGIIEFLFSC